MKKVNLLVGMFSALALVAGATSCSALDGFTSGNGQFTSKEKQNVEALTSIKLLESTMGGNTGIRMAAAVEAAPVDTTDIEKVLPSIDALLNNGSVIESTVTETPTTIGEVTYQFKEEIKYKNADLKDASYTLVYNKEAIAKDQKDESNKDDKEDEEKVENTGDVKKAAEAPTDPNAEATPAPEGTVTPETKPDTTPTPDAKPQEVEKEEKLVGLVLLPEDKHYAFTSKAESEVEGQEQESERFFTIEIDETSYIEVVESAEIEANETETEFEYTFVNKGEVELNYSLSIENEKDELTEVTYELNGIEYEVTKKVENEKEIYVVDREDSNDKEDTFYFEKVVNPDDGTATFVKVSK